MKKKLLCALLMLALVLPLCLPQSTVTADAASNEYKAVWFSYYDYENLYLNKYENKNTKKNFKKFFRSVITDCKSKGFNRIIVQVRPFGDALYKKTTLSNFPTSACIAGKQGASLSYDPLSIMVSEAHRQGLKIEAWINPYRVAAHTDYNKLAASNPARKWHNSSKKSTRRNVLAYDGKLYYNPSKSAVRTLIINGVKEIVKNYKVDGIHMDDYFYPSFTSKNYKKVFDAKEYNASKEKKAGMSIENYRRKQVNLLVSGIYKAIKSINKKVTFGISPAGNIDNLNSKYQYYVSIKTWCNSTKYVDYIAPQVYWGFNHSTAKFNKVVDRWKKLTNQSKVKLYIGLPAYRMGTKTGSNAKENKEFKNSDTLAKMIRYGRSKKVDGFAVFDYSDLNRSAIKKTVTKMTKELKK